MNILYIIYKYYMNVCIMCVCCISTSCLDNQKAATLYVYPDMWLLSNPCKLDVVLCSPKGE